MIVTVIVGALLLLLGAVIGLIPEFQPFEVDGMLGSGTTGGFFDSIAGILLSLNLFIPITTMFACFLAIIATKAFVGVAQLAVFVWDKLPFKSS